MLGRILLSFILTASAMQKIEIGFFFLIAGQCIDAEMTLLYPTSIILDALECKTRELLKQMAFSYIDTLLVWGNAGT
jgi:hypothetical protein